MDKKRFIKGVKHKTVVVESAFGVVTKIKVRRRKPRKIKKQ